MNSSEFNLDGLARYLGMHRDDVQRMANRGQLPGRQVAGNWRFNAPEIHRWVELQMETANEGELLEAERRWKRNTPETAGHVRPVSEMMPAGAINLDLPARTRASAIRRMTELAATTGLLWDRRRMEEALRAREDVHSTAMDNGVALLHPQRPQNSILAAPLIALGQTAQGIPFGGPGGSLTHTFLLICSINETEHLYTLARISRLIRADGFLDTVRNAEDSGSVVEWIKKWEATQHDG